MKQYLSNPMILMQPQEGQPIFLYLTVLETYAGAMLAQGIPGMNKEQAIYYLSKKFLKYEIKYSSLDKRCLALVWAC